MNENFKPGLRRLIRGLLLTLVGTIAGAAVGFVLYLIVSFGWELLSDCLSSPATPRSPRGGDPIDGWARGVVRMMYFGLFVIPCAAVGLYVGLRAALSGPESLRNLERESRETIGGMAQGLFRTDDMAGRYCLLLAVCYWPVGWIGLSMPGIDKKVGSLFLLELLIIAVATWCGIKALSTPPRGKAIVGLILTMCCFLTWCQFLYGVGLTRVFQRIW